MKECDMDAAATDADIIRVNLLDVPRLKTDALDGKSSNHADALHVLFVNENRPKGVQLVHETEERGVRNMDGFDPLYANNRRHDLVSYFYTCSTDQVKSTDRWHMQMSCLLFILLPRTMKDLRRPRIRDFLCLCASGWGPPKQLRRSTFPGDQSLSRLVFRLFFSTVLFLS